MNVQYVWVTDEIIEKLPFPPIFFFLDLPGSRHYVQVSH